MQPVPDWLLLWKELVETKENGNGSTDMDEDKWHARAREYHKAVQRRWEKPDSSRTFITAQIQAHPGSSVLDIGAGSGAWTLLLAHHAGHVTAVEPSPAMAAVLHENIEAEKPGNVTVVEGAWPEVDVPPHDFTLCSHAMYGCVDFRRFIERMVDVTRRSCFLLLRAPTPKGPFFEAAEHIWGQPHDSPNFQIAYNALLQMGIYPNVLIEDSGLWDPRRHESFEEAFVYFKRHFGLSKDDTHDAFLAEVLHRTLAYDGESYIWPEGTRSALVYWDVGPTD